MLRYTCYQKNPASHYIYIDLQISDIQTDTLRLHLPVWRPGRYELGNFARNLKKLQVWDAQGNPLACTKVAKSTWEVQTQKQNQITVTYSYYAAELNAGACYASDQMLYINPVHCCLWVEGMEFKPHAIQLNVPAHFSTVTSLSQNEPGWFEASSFDVLADSPLVSSEQIQSFNYQIKNCTFWVHFSGACVPDWNVMRSDFERFTLKQIEFWQNIPVQQFHFIVLALPYSFYHGVEHLNSTVFALGPAETIQTSGYEDFLGLASHELFHVWNIKTLRPSVFLPYSFSTETYSDAGCIYEGCTTYYGDKLLYASGVFNWEQFASCLEERLTRHIHNYGKYNISLAETSIDTWLDGYVPGAPYRKSSIYDEGCLFAMTLDASLYQRSEGRYTLRSVLRHAFQSPSRYNGYGLRDLFTWIQKACQLDFSSLLQQWLYTPFDFYTELSNLLPHFGLTLKLHPSLQTSESRFGFSVSENQIIRVAPYSPAWKAGLFNQTRIRSINGQKIGTNLNAELEQACLHHPSIRLELLQEFRERTVELQVKASDTSYYPQIKIQRSDEIKFQKHHGFFTE